MKHTVANSAKAGHALDSEGADLAQLAEGVFRRYGYDLRHFSGAYLRRRLEAAMRWEEVATLGKFRERLLTQPELMERLLMSLSGGPRPMFRDVSLHQYLRREIVPVLRTYPFVRIWVPGCGTGPEVYGLAVLLAEEGLYERCRIYATDISQEAVRRAKDGLYPMSAVKKWSEGHIQSGGKAPLSEYLESDGGKASFLPQLRKNVVFAQHNLAIDGSFNEFNLILCRNVLSTLDGAVRKRVHGLIHQSLAMFGFLALGSRETPAGVEGADAWYQEMDAKHRIYRKVG